MKCNFQLLRDKNTGKIIYSLPSVWIVADFVSTLRPKQQEKIDLTHIEVCGGKILSEIRCHDEPYFGGTYAEMDIAFVCEKCKQTYFPELPQSLVSLNEWITKKIEGQ